MRSATFEAANVRHQHEWRVWQNSKIPEQKILMPGVEINLFRPAGSVDIASCFIDNLLARHTSAVETRAQGNAGQDRPGAVERLHQRPH